MKTQIAVFTICIAFIVGVSVFSNPFIKGVSDFESASLFGGQGGCADIVTDEARCNDSEECGELKISCAGDLNFSTGTGTGNYQDFNPEDCTNTCGTKCCTRSYQWQDCNGNWHNFFPS